MCCSPMDSGAGWVVSCRAPDPSAFMIQSSMAAASPERKSTFVPSGETAGSNLGGEEVEDIGIREMSANPGALPGAPCTEQEEGRARRAEGTRKHRHQIYRQFGVDVYTALPASGEKRPASLRGVPVAMMAMSRYSNSSATPSSQKSNCCGSDSSPFAKTALKYWLQLSPFVDWSHTRVTVLPDGMPPPMLKVSVYRPKSQIELNLWSGVLGGRGERQGPTDRGA